MAFIVVGAVGFVRMAAWMLLYDKPTEQKRLSKAELDYILSDEQAQTSEDANKLTSLQLTTFRQTWAFVIGTFLTDGVWWFYLFWLPQYLSVQYGIQKTELALPLAVLYSMTLIGSIGGGWFPTYFMNKGHAPYDDRMKAMLAITVFPLAVLLAQPLGYISFWVPVLLIGIGASAHQAWSANIFTTVSDMFPKNSIATVVGMGGMAGGLGGVLLSKVGGWLFDYYGAQGHIEIGYSIMFGFCATAYLLAWSIMQLLVPKSAVIAD